jgi:hypothetical protein
MKYSIQTMFAHVAKGNKCAQVFSAKDFIRFHPMESKAECGQALQTFAEDVGIPADLITTDGAKKKQRPTEPYTQRQNEAETAIRELRRDGKNKMVTKIHRRFVWMHTSR